MPTPNDSQDTPDITGQQDFGQDAPLSPLEAASSGAQTPEVAADRAAIEQGKAARSGAYSAIQKALSNATARLQALQYGPSDEEMRLRQSAALIGPSPNGHPSFSNDLGAMYGARAQALAERREAQLQQQQDIIRMQMQGASSALAGANAGINTNLAQQRVDQMGANTLARTGITWDKDGRIHLSQGWQNSKAIVDYLNLTYGKGFRTMKLPDQSETIVPANKGTQNPGVDFGGVSPGTVAPQAPNPAPAAASGMTPQPQPAAQPQPAPVATGAQPAAAGAPHQQPPVLSNNPEYDNTWTGLPQDLPQTQLSDEKYRPLYGNVYSQAVAAIKKMPLPPGQGQYGMSINNKIQAKANEDIDTEEAKDANKRDADARNNVYIASRMLKLIENNQLSNTGPVGAWLLPVRQQLAAMGVIDAKAAENTTSGDEEFQKEARVLSSSGLKDLFGGKITNFELDNQLRSNPSLAMTPTAMKAILQMALERDTMTLHRDSMYAAYRAHDGAPRDFENWYRHWFDTQSYSVANRLIEQKGGVLDQKQPMVFQAKELPIFRPDGWELHKKQVNGVYQYAYINPKNPQQIAPIKVANGPN